MGEATSLQPSTALTALAAAPCNHASSLPTLCPGTTPNVRAAYLVDPVDGFKLTEGRLGYPSATKLLRDRSMKLGITGEGGITWG